MRKITLPILFCAIGLSACGGAPNDATVNPMSNAPVNMAGPPAPANITLVDEAGAGRVSLRWNDSADQIPVTHYQIFRSDNPDTPVGVSSIPQYDDISVLGGVHYRYTIHAVNLANKVSTPSAIDVMTRDSEDQHPPSPPQNLQTTSTLPTRVDLNWTPSKDNVGVSVYQIFRNGSAIVFAETTQPRFSDNTVLGATNYTYQVRALDAARNASAYSHRESLTTKPALDTEKPSAPTNIQSIDASTTKVNLRWNASLDNVGIASYQVFRSGLATPVCQTTTNFCIDDNVQAERSYVYNVKAIDSSNNVSLLSQALHVKTSLTERASTLSPSLSPPPGAMATTLAGPTDITAKADGTTQVLLTWKRSVDRAVVKYLIFRDSLTTPIATTNSRSVYFVDNGVQAGKTYTYYMKAMDGANRMSIASAAVRVNTPVDTTAPSAPRTLTAKVNSATKITLNWRRSVDTDVVEYQIFRDGLSNKIGSTNRYTTTYADSTVQAGKSYTYYVKAKDAANNLSNASLPATATTPNSGTDTTPPAQVTSGQATVSGVNQITLSWTPSADNIGGVGGVRYRIQQMGGSAVETTMSTITFTNLQNGATYAYTITAIDAANNAALASNPVTVQIPDTLPPSAFILQPATIINATSIALTWAAAVDNVGIVKYEIWRNHSLLATISPGTSFTDTNSSGSTLYAYQIKAYDAAGLSSS